MSPLINCTNTILISLGLISVTIYGQGVSPCDFSKPGSSLAKWYPDNQSLIFYQSGEKEGIYKINADGTGYVRLISSDKKIGHPSVAPDNETILYQKRITSTNKNALLLRYGNGEDLIITDTLCNSTDGSISPQGDWVAYAGDDQEGNLDIYIVNIDGQSKRRLTSDDSYDYSPHWSPDGSKILFTSHREGHPNIYVMDMDGSNKKNLTPGPDEEFSASWGPDGKRIVYSSRKPKANEGMDPATKHNTSELHILNLLDGKTRQITDNTDMDVLPHWSPDGKKIAYTTCAGGTREIFIIHIGGSHTFQVTKTD